MHHADFSVDLAPTRAQYRRLALELLRLAGEDAPVTRYEATELLLRLEASDPGAESAAAAHGTSSPAELNGLRNIVQADLDATAARLTARGDRSPERRTGARQ